MNAEPIIATRSARFVIFDTFPFDRVSRHDPVEDRSRPAVGSTCCAK